MIFVHPYALQKKATLNALDNIMEPRKGCLVKITENANWGVADLSPWLELGDESYENEIRSGGKLFQHSIWLANNDLKARTNKLSLRRNKNIKNNTLITDFNNWSFSETQLKGKVVKIKGSKQFQLLAEKLNSANDEIEFRIDFNSSLTELEFDLFLNLLTKKTIAKIQYIEDPTVWSDKWNLWESKVKLAYDWQKFPYDTSKAKVKITKPSREKVDANFSQQVLTSAMEHPVGLAHALCAAQNYPEHIAGLLTLNLFEENVFHHYFYFDEQNINFKNAELGYGIGMTDELESLDWIPIDDFI